MKCRYQIVDFRIIGQGQKSVGKACGHIELATILRGKLEG
jgi:hypothetical protein